MTKNEVKKCSENVTKGLRSFERVNSHYLEPKFKLVIVKCIQNFALIFVTSDFSQIW